MRFFGPGRERLGWSIVRTAFTLAPIYTGHSSFSQFSGRNPKGIAKDDIRLLKRQMKRYASSGGYINDLNNRIGKAMRSKLKCPTLIVHSRNNCSVSPDMARNTADHIPRAQLL